MLTIISYINKFIDSNTKDSFINDLYGALGMRDANKVKNLLKANVDTDITTPMGKAQSSPLHLAVYYDCADTLNALLENGSIKNPKDIEEAFKFAIDSSCFETATVFLNKNLIDFKMIDQIDGCPMGISNIRKGMQKLRELSYEDSEFMFDKERLDKCKKFVFELIAANKFQINAPDMDGGTVLHSAAFFGLKEVIEELINNGGDPSIKNKYGATPLSIFQELCDRGRQRSREEDDNEMSDSDKEILKLLETEHTIEQTRKKFKNE